MRAACDGAPCFKVYKKAVFHDVKHGLSICNKPPLARLKAAYRGTERNAHAISTLRNVSKITVCKPVTTPFSAL